MNVAVFLCAEHGGEQVRLNPTLEYMSRGALLDGDGGLHSSVFGPIMQRSLSQAAQEADLGT